MALTLDDDDDRQECVLYISIYVCIYISLSIDMYVYIYIYISCTAVYCQLSSFDYDSVYTYQNRCIHIDISRRIKKGKEEISIVILQALYP